MTKKGNVARSHHYIPQFYLRGFSEGSGKRCQIKVMESENGRIFETNPKNVCTERDFNRIEIPGFKPDALEGMLSNFEGQVATAIRNISESRVFDGEDRIVVLNLIAALAVRTPHFRENIRQFMEQVCKQMMGLTLASKERWEGQMEQMKRAGRDVDESLSYEEICEFHKSDEYKVGLKQEFQIGLEFRGVNTVIPPLMDRNWSLYITNESIGHFITTDRPVVIRFNEPEKIPLFYRNSPGFALKDTKVFFAITKNMAIIGEFDGKLGTYDATTSFVAAINMSILMLVVRQAYLPKRSFPYIGPDQVVYHDRYFLDRYRLAES